MHHTELLRKEIAWRTVYLSYYRTKRDFAQTIRRKSNDLTGAVRFLRCALTIAHSRGEIVQNAHSRGRIVQKNAN